MKKIILASNSPRRKELMKFLGYDFEIIASDIEEVINPKMEHDELVMDLAFQKAYSIFKDHKEDIVIGFDTLVVVDDFVLGKPKDQEEAAVFLNILSNRTHRVLTGCTILTRGFSKSFISEALVTFYPMDEQEIKDYIETGEPMDKAGAYGIQGYGAKFVNKVNGDYFTIVGFPIAKLYHELTEILKR
ncbi:MAG: septum formation protein Maf [Bacilli bacterium]|nr:septum formation protein Maf [Bacilli bacterium]